MQYWWGLIYCSFCSGVAHLGLFNSTIAICANCDQCFFLLVIFNIVANFGFCASWLQLYNFVAILIFANLTQVLFYCFLTFFSFFFFFTCPFPIDLKQLYRFWCGFGKSHGSFHLDFLRCNQVIVSLVSFASYLVFSLISFIW